MSITETIPPVNSYTGTVPDKSTQSEEDFANNVYPFHIYYNDTFISETLALSEAMDIYATQANALAVEVNSNAVIAAGSANNKGAWSLLTGALNVPAAVNHTGSTWILNLDIADVTASEPTSINTDWTESSGVTQEELDEKAALAGARFTGQVKLDKGADVASATALPILTDGNTFNVTGTTAITSINTTGAIGTVIKLHFNAALILTHDATDLFLPGEADITTSAGDEFEFTEYASGDFRCTGYALASGKAVGSALTGFKNKLINGDFQINQYADIDTAPVAVVNDTYQIDRHKSILTVVTGTIQRLAEALINGKYVNALKFVAGSTASGTIGSKQLSEVFYNGESKTFGVWIKSNNANARALLYDGVLYTSSTAHTGGGAYEFLSFPKTIDASATQLGAFAVIASATLTAVSITTADYIESTMGQLEDNLEATNYEQRPIGLELSLCQRYYESSIDAALRVIGYEASASLVYIGIVQYKVRKRVAPTVAYSNYTGSGYTIGAIAINVNRLDSFFSVDTTASGGTAGHACFSGFSWTSDAEL